MNDEQMKEKLSALVDNELNELEERRVFTALQGDGSLRDTWERYHLVRAALRQDMEILAAHDTAGRVTTRLDAEPSRTASFKRQAISRFIGTFAIAASVAAIAIVGVQWIHQPSSSLQQLVAANKPVAEKTVRSGTTRWDMKEPETESALNAYLVEHDEFASTSGIGGMMPYVRVVTYDNDK